MYPVTLNLQQRNCVVAGGGKIAFFKTRPLIEAGAKVTVVSPVFCEEFLELHRAGLIEVKRKEIDQTDYQGAFLIIAATDSREVNEDIFRNAEKHQLVNVISNQELGNFHLPATLKRGKLSISVSTNGASPKLAKKIRDQLYETYDESYEEFLDFLQAVRNQIKQGNFTKEEKTQLLNEAIKDPLRNSREIRDEFLQTIMKVK